MNENLILNLIKTHGLISRTDLARLSNLSPATVSNLTNDLLATDLVHEIGAGESRGGRRPVLLRINNQAGYVVGVKLMEQSITSALTDLDAQVLHHQVTHLSSLNEEQTSTGQRRVTPDELLPLLIQAIEETIAASSIKRQRVLGIGVGMAGLVDGHAGICRFSPFFDWQDADIAAPIAAHFDLPVYLENDVNTLTIAEKWFGYGHNVDHFIVVTVGRGIGAGIVVNGQIYRGLLGGAGEIGHITVFRDGPLCACGKRGCLEAVASDQAIVDQTKAALIDGAKSVLQDERPLTFEKIITAAEQGDGLAQQQIADAGEWLGIGIAALVNTLNPQMVVIGGEGVQAGNWRLEPMRKAIQAHTFRGLADQLEIVIEPSGDEAWARGAACVVLGELFKSPIHQQGEPHLMSMMG
ncbi:MAG: ROK family transcriptional regulator [Anaerolineales bacterium]|nr:ROK family transcriptional regulator [Anaerolineales bacterium]